MFRMKGAYLVNERGKVMEVQGKADNENQYIYASKRNNQIHQQWDVIYADQWKRDPKKGELNKRFGLYVQRDFHIVSRMGRHRYLDVISRKFVIKTRNGRKSQVWWFDQASLTIKSRHFNQSWHIKSNGGAKEMEVSGTNSKWW
jgi:hypothetical protein